MEESIPETDLKSNLNKIIVIPKASISQMVQLQKMRLTKMKKIIAQNNIFCSMEMRIINTEKKIAAIRYKFNSFHYFAYYSKNRFKGEVMK